MRRYDAAIFDMDGVLLDSEPLHFRALNELLAAEGRALTQQENEEFIGATLEATWSSLVERFGLRQPIEAYMQHYDRAVLAILSGRLEPAPGAVALLDALRHARVPLALASSSKRGWIEATLSSLGLSHYFHVVVSGDDVSNGKPDPEIFLLAAQQLDKAPEHCLVVEDSPHGVAAAKRAGMTVVAVRTPYTAHLTLPDADLVVDSLAEVDLVRLGFE